MYVPFIPQRYVNHVVLFEDNLAERVQIHKCLQISINQVYQLLHENTGEKFKSVILSNSKKIIQCSSSGTDSPMTWVTNDLDTTFEMLESRKSNHLYKTSPD